MVGPSPGRGSTTHLLSSLGVFPLPKADMSYIGPLAPRLWSQMSSNVGLGPPFQTWLTQLPTQVIPSGVLWITFAPEAVIAFNTADSNAIPRLYPRPWPGIFGAAWNQSFGRANPVPTVDAAPIRSVDQFPLSEFPDSAMPGASPWVVAVRNSWRRDGSWKPLSVQLTSVDGLRSLLRYSPVALMVSRGPTGTNTWN